MFTDHKQIGWLYLILSLIMFGLIKKLNLTGFVGKLNIWTLSVFLLQVFTGIVLTYFALAPWAQAVHVFLAVVVFALQAYLVFIFFTPKHNLIKA